MSTKSVAPPTESERAALELLARGGRYTRGALAQQLGITPPAVAQAIERLLERDIRIIEADQPTGRGGQAARTYELDPPHGIMAVGVDLTEDRIRVGLFAPGGKLVGDLRELDGLGLQTSQPADALDAIADAIEVLVVHGNPDDVLGIGVAVAGPIDAQERMLRPGPVGSAWEAMDLGKEFEGRFPDYESWKIEADNDANLGAIAEHRRGAASGYRDAVFVRWISGIGSGLVLDDKPCTGVRGISGELGHIILPSNGPTPAPAGAEVCPWCGQMCFQSLAGVRTIVRDALAADADLQVGAGLKPDIDDVIRAATNGDQAAREAIARAAGHVGTILAIVVDLLNPGVVVLGGAFGRADYTLVIPKIQEAMRASSIQPAFRDVRIVMASEDEDAGGGPVLRGAALRVFDRHLAARLLPDERLTTA